MKRLFLTTASSWTNLFGLEKEQNVWYHMRDVLHRIEDQQKKFF
jgi:hypothetical protein